MLAEMNRESDLIDERQRRLEQVVAYYIALLTALIAAGVAVETKAIGIFQSILILVICLLGAVVGNVTFMAILLKVGEITASHSQFYARRQYFLDKFPHIRRYVENRPNKQIKEVWHVYFNRPLVVFLRLFAIFNSLLFSIFCGMTMYLILDSIQANISSWGLCSLIISITIGFLFFILLLLYLLRLLSRNINRVKELSYSILADFNFSNSSNLKTQPKKKAS